MEVAESDRVQTVSVLERGGCGVLEEDSQGQDLMEKGLETRGMKELHLIA